MPAPDLDQLRFQELVNEAKLQLPHLYPPWTEHNVSDPGITLLEACAQRVDQLSYRLNHPPERALLSLLRLLDTQPYPPAPSRLTLQITSKKSTPLTIPAGTLIKDVHHNTEWRTTAPLELPPDKSIQLQAIATKTIVENLGKSTAQPGQRFRPTHPTHDPHPTLTIDADTWPLVRSFAYQKSDTPCYTWNPNIQEIAFGPETPYATDPRQHGKIPPLGADITLTYQSATPTPPHPSTLHLYLQNNNTPEPLITITIQKHQPYSPPETLHETLQRISHGLLPLQRAVTPHDYETLLQQRLPSIKRATVSAPFITLAPPCTADAWVSPRSSENTSNLRAKTSDEQIAYIRFDGSRLAGVITDAKLYLYCNFSNANRFTAIFSRADSGWGENEIEWTSRPQIHEEVGRVIPRQYSWVEIDVTNYVRRYGGGDLSLAVTADDGEVGFASRETSYIPRLTVEMQGGDTFRPDTINIAALPPETVPAAIEELKNVRLIGSGITVSPPTDYKVTIEATITLQPSEHSPEDAQKQALDAIEAYFHWTTGGDNKTGWPWNRPMRVADIYRILDDLPRVRSTSKVTLKDPAGEETDRVPLPVGALFTPDITITASTPEA
ncbi:DNRLRE domain-containing protein [Streptomyces lavendulae]|uniref:CBM96 family carbohydrate-binding protein n=1 Tax=Streptomyces lavendulae TaxID=1914 RepID=UPI0033C9DA32